MDKSMVWAKLVRDADERAVLAALPLLDHCLDVAAAFAAILPAWRKVMETAAGRVLTDQDVARLTVLVALHDVGKANRGFQVRIDAQARPIVGHTAPVAALLNHSKLRQGAAATALREMIASWRARDHFAAVMAHHGKPLAAFHRDAQTRGTDSWTGHVGHWWPENGHDPAADALPVIEALRARWPLAWEDGPPLPDAPRFVALFAGLVTLADWLGSDETRFPVAGPHGGARDEMRHANARDAARVRGLQPLLTPDTDFLAAFGNAPFAFQRDAATDDLGPVALIEAETGSGKTEAALWRWLELRRRGDVDGLFFALPTRAAAVQLHGRVNDMLQSVWGGAAPLAVLAVPGYLRAGDAQGQALPGFRVRWDKGEPGAADDERWAAERANRFLAARVAVGTVDQALLGTLPVKHALFRAGVMARSLLVVDEVHASDAYMAGLLERLLEHHVAVGGHALLLSATLGGEARARLLKAPRPTLAQARDVPYPALSGYAATPRAVQGATTTKRVTIETAGLIADHDAIASRAVAAAREGASVLVVRNTVDVAVAVAQAVAAMAPEVAFKVGRVATVHHGRFAPDDRRLLDDAVTAAYGKGRAARGQVLVGTQTLEQSLDIDADVLITDLAPMDVLLQRIGRLHRHPRQDRGTFADARVLVLRPANRDLGALLDGARPRHGLGGRVYPHLGQLEATLRLLEQSPVIAIPQDNRRLVEQALHSDGLAAIAAEGGAAWINHANDRSGARARDRQSAGSIALNLSQRFSELVFTSDVEAVMTRLGARDLLVDLPEPLTGPFGTEVARITIAGWMVTGLSETPAERVDAQHLRVGTRTFAYDAWGLRRVD